MTKRDYMKLENGKKYFLARPTEILSKGIGIYSGFTYMFGNKEKEVFVVKANVSASAFYIIQCFRYGMAISIDGNEYVELGNALQPEEINYIAIFNHEDELVEEINFREEGFRPAYLLRKYDEIEMANQKEYLKNKKFNGYKESLK